jgi:hypothetical protein
MAAVVLAAIVGSVVLGAGLTLWAWCKYRKVSNDRKRKTRRIYETIVAYEKVATVDGHVEDTDVPVVSV